MFRQAVGVSLLVGSVVGCGASYQRVYEGDVRFEHCYHLDADPRVSQEARRECWAEWAGGHTQGQTRDRVEYAATRQRALLAGDMRPTGPTVLLSAAPPLTPPPASPPRHAQSNLGTIGRQSASLVARPAVPAAPPPASPAADLSTTQSCKQDCGKGFTACIVGCDAGACLRRCGDVVKACVDDCL
jgi:hypothetical protein